MRNSSAIHPHKNPRLDFSCFGSRTQISSAESIGSDSITNQWGQTRLINCLD